MEESFFILSPWSLVSSYCSIQGVNDNVDSEHSTWSSSVGLGMVYAQWIRLDNSSKDMHAIADCGDVVVLVVVV